MIAGTIPDNDIVNGIMLNVKKEFYRVELWLQNYDKDMTIEISDYINEYLQLGGVKFVYEPHHTKVRK